MEKMSLLSLYHRIQSQYGMSRVGWVYHFILLGA